MMEKDVSALVDLMEVRQQEAQFALKAVLQEEARLRGLLEGLKARDSQARAAFDKEHKLRALGLDLAWSHWSSERQKELNLRLARQRAHHEHALFGLKRAFGKHQAMGFLAQGVQDAQKAGKAREAEEELQALTVMSSATSG